MNSFFFELIRVAIGKQACLSRTLDEHEWMELYSIAKKQSLLGVSFAGIQKLQIQHQSPPEILYLKWMGMAAKIQQRNEYVNRKCLDLQDILIKDGFKFCILKGQGNAYLYNNLASLRQPGDIDVWVNVSRKVLVDYAQNYYATNLVKEHHIDFNVFDDIEVELHFKPIMVRNFAKNRTLQSLFDVMRQRQFNNILPNGLHVPTSDFSAVQQMAHMYHHLFAGGVGLRQVMDYYFLLDSSLIDGKDLERQFKKIGILKFAKAVLWIIKDLFGLEPDKIPFEVNIDDGKFLLNEIMHTGNFGKYDDRHDRDISTYFSSFWTTIRHNLRLLRFDYFEWFWGSLWRLYYFGWRKVNGYE